jgi:hypothetical protein
MVCCLDNGAKVVIIAVTQWKNEGTVILAIVRHPTADLVLDLI